MTTQRETNDGIPRQAQGTACSDIARRMAKYSTDPKWPAQFDEGDSRVAERVDGLEVAVESEIGTQKPRTEKPEPDASRVGAADAPTPPLGRGTASKRDGRHLRSDTTKAKLLAACSDLMVLGTLGFRPSMAGICHAARLSVRTGFQHFPTVETLRTEALADEATREAVLDRAVGPLQSHLSDEVRDRILRAIYGGR